MSRALIDQALIQAFRGAALGLPTAYANHPPVDPDTNTIIGSLAGQPWARVTILHARPTVATMGLDGRDQIDGIMQIDLFYPKNSGTAEPHAKADALAATFFAGSTHSAGGVDVHIDSCGRIGSVDNSDNHQTIIEITFHAWIER